MAVGVNSYVLTSVSGDTWRRQSRTINLYYTLAPSVGSALGTNELTFDYPGAFNVGDEVVRSSLLVTDDYTFVTNINNYVHLDRAVANAIATGTTLEYFNQIDGTTITGKVTRDVAAQDTNIYVDNAELIQRGTIVSVRGIDTVHRTQVSNVVGNNIYLSIPTTNVIAAGTHITFDDLTGNVHVLVTANITNNAAQAITFVTAAGIDSTYYPRITAIAPGSVVFSKFTTITMDQSLGKSVQIGSDIDFRGVITQPTPTGGTVIHISNTSRISVGSLVSSVVVNSYTDAASTWSAPAGSVTSLVITVPKAKINGDVFRGMRVIGPGLPSSSVITDVQISGVNASITLGFIASTGIPAGNAASVSFVSQALVLDGTLVISKSANTVTLSNPLLYDLPLGGDSLLQFGLPDLQLNSIKYLNGQWIAVGAQGLVINQSTVTGSWQQRYALPYGDLLDIGYDPVSGIYVVVGTEGIISYSQDLESWTSPTIIAGAVVTLRSIEYGNVQIGSVFTPQWTIVGDNGIVLFNDNVDSDFTNQTISWQVITGVPAVNYHSVAYFDQWIAVGDLGTVLLSTDGAEWTDYNAGITDGLRSIAYINNNYYVTGTRGAIVISSDGTAWTVEPRVVANDINGIARQSPTPVAVGNGSILLTESRVFTVDWAVRDVRFDQFNWASLTDLSRLGYRVSDGDTLIFAQQEGFAGTNSYTDSAANWGGVSNSTYVDISVPALNIHGTIVPGMLVNGTGLPNGTVLDTIQIIGSDTLIRVRFPLSALIPAGINVALAFIPQGNNDGWNLHDMLYDQSSSISTVGTGFDNDVFTFDSVQIIPGYYDNLQDPFVSNQRAGIWRVDVITTPDQQQPVVSLVRLTFLRQVALGQEIIIKNDVSKLFLDPQIKPGKTVPEYSPLSQLQHNAQQSTTFDGKGTRFSNNRDNYVEPGTLDKYLKFRKTGVFR